MSKPNEQGPADCSAAPRTSRGKQSGSREGRVSVDPVIGITTGAELYESLTGMLAEFDDESDLDLEVVAEAIEGFDATLAEQFRAAPETIEAAEAANTSAAAAQAEVVLAPFLSKIDNYVQRFSDAKQKYPGGGYTFPSVRTWARVFLRGYVLARGALPVGRHRIVGPGYRGHEHDFPADWDAI